MLNRLDNEVKTFTAVYYRTPPGQAVRGHVHAHVARMINHAFATGTAAGGNDQQLCLYKIFFLVCVNRCVRDFWEYKRQKFTTQMRIKNKRVEGGKKIKKS